MIYRNDELAASAQIRCLEREITALGQEPHVQAARSLRAQIRREQRRGERAARALERRRRGGSWIVPPSVTEVVVACAVAYATLTLALGIAFMGLCVVSLV